MEKVYKGFTEKELRNAFDKVKDPTDWRNPIYRRVWIKKIDVTVAAIEFFTGAEVKKKLHPSGNDYYVECEGYRNGPCGP